MRTCAKLIRTHTHINKSWQHTTTRTLRTWQNRARPLKTVTCPTTPTFKQNETTRALTQLTANRKKRTHKFNSNNCLHTNIHTTKTNNEQELKTYTYKQHILQHMPTHTDLLQYTHILCASAWAHGACTHSNQTQTNWTQWTHNNLQTRRPQ